MLEPFDDDMTKTDFLSSGWESIVSECDKKECQCYFSPFLNESRKAEEAGDTKRFQVYRLLVYVTSLRLNLDTPTEPLQPLFISQGGRSAIVDDFDDSHLRFFGDIVVDIADASLQARIADLLWLRKKNYRYGEIAVEAYLKSAEALESFQHWGFPADSIERARQITLNLGKSRAWYARVVKYIEDVLMACNGEDPYLLSYKLMELLIERKEGDPAMYAPLAEKLALKAEAKNDWEKARQHWEIKAEWHKIGKDSEEAKRSRIRAVECYVKHAEIYVKCVHPQGSMVLLPIGFN